MIDQTFDLQPRIELLGWTGSLGLGRESHVLTPCGLLENSRLVRATAAEESGASKVCWIVVSRRWRGQFYYILSYRVNSQ
jgi:hypothetical protein